MTRSLKTLLLILALAALPLRGVAAVAMWHCAQEQHDAMSASADQHAGHRGTAGHHGTDGDASMDHSAHHAPTSDEPAGGPSSSADSHVASTCSACTACCMGGSIAPTAWSSFSFAPIGASRIAFVEQRFTGVVPAQLDRPPLVHSL